LVLRLTILSLCCCSCAPLSHWNNCSTFLLSNLSFGCQILARSYWSCCWGSDNTDEVRSITDRWLSLFAHGIFVLLRSLFLEGWSCGALFMSRSTCQWWFAASAIVGSWRGDSFLDVVAARFSLILIHDSHHIAQILGSLRARLSLVRLWKLYWCVITVSHMLRLLLWLRAPFAWTTSLPLWNFSLLIHILSTHWNILVCILRRLHLLGVETLLLHIGLLQCSKHMHLHLNLLVLFWRPWSFLRLPTHSRSLTRCSFGGLGWFCLVVVCHALTKVAWALRAARLVVLIDLDVVDL